jgi:hypothetical protein
VGFIAIGALGCLLVALVASIVVADRRSRRARVEDRRRLNEALKSVDRARGIDLEQTHLIAWRDRRDELTYDLDPGRTRIISPRP